MEAGCDSTLADTASQRRGGQQSSFLRTVADHSSATETIPIMTSTTSAPVATGTTTSAPASGSSGRVSNAYQTTFGMPSGIHLFQFDGSAWSTWSGTIEAILTLHEAEDVFTLTSPPSRIDQSDWDSIQRRTKAYLCLYVKPDVYSLIASDTDYPTFKQKWDKLKDTYGGATGSTTIFNLWIQLTQA